MTVPPATYLTPPLQMLYSANPGWLDERERSG